MIRLLDRIPGQRRTNPLGVLRGGLLAGAAGGLRRHRLDSLIIGTDDSVTVVIIQDARDEKLPGLVSKFYPCDWQVVHNETWSPIGDGQVRGEVSVAARGARSAGIRARHGFARTGAERLATEVHRDCGVQNPVGRRQDRELGRPPVGQTIFGHTRLHREVDHGACLTKGRPQRRLDRRYPLSLDNLLHMPVPAAAGRRHIQLTRRAIDRSGMDSHAGRCRAS
jgi:hypothetical protein